jgi:hypothetical protein
MTTPSKPTKRAAKLAAVPPPTPTEVREPLIRVAFTAGDFRRLLDHVEGWEDPVSHKLRLAYSRFRMKNLG